MSNSARSSFSLRSLRLTTQLSTSRRCLRFGLRLAVFCSALLAAFPVMLPAQAVSFAGAQTTLGSGFHYPSDVAVDLSGNVFVSDAGNDAVKEILAAGDYTTVNTLGSEIDFPTGLAIDGNDNVFVADYPDNWVKEIPAAGGYTTVNTLGTYGSDFDGPEGVAVDGSDNVFVADSRNSLVKELLAASGYSYLTINFLGSGFAYPSDVAVDGNGNVFVADTGNNAVKEILAAGGYTTVNTLGSGFSSPHGVAVDGGGNVFVADPGNNAVKEILAAGGYTTVNTLGSGFSGPGGVAVDESGNVFVADTSNSRVVELQRTSVNFASANLCLDGQTTPAPCSQTLTLNYNVTASGTLGTPKVLTLGAPNLDFTLASGSTCTGAVAAGAVCTVNVIFSPLATRVRNGSVEITDEGGNVLATTSVYGFGQVPPSGPPVAQISTALLSFGTIIFAPSNSETLPLTIANVGGGTLTVSPSINGPSYSIAGNTCMSGVSAGGSCVLTIQFAPVRVGLHHDTLTLQSNGLSSPALVDLTGTGSGVGPETEGALNFGTIPFGTSTVLPLTIFNVGVAGEVTVTASIDDPNFTVLTNAQNTCLAGISSGQSCVLPVEFAPAWAGVHSNHVTVTSSDWGALSVVALYGVAFAPTSVSFAGTQTTLGSGFDGPIDVAVDGKDNVFVAVYGNNAVDEILAAGGYTTVNTIGSGFNGPHGLAIEGKDNVFVADSGNNAVKEFLASGGYTTVNTIGSGFDFPEGVVVDGKGDVFVADTSSGAVKEILAVDGSIPVNPTINTLGSGFSAPRDVAVDGSGNVFVAVGQFYPESAVYEILAAGGYTTVNTLGSGFSIPYGVAVDGNGNVFVADTYNSAVKEILAADGYTRVNTLGSGFSYPYGVAVDGSGNVFVADTGNNRVVELQRTSSVNYGSVNLCPSAEPEPAGCSQTLTLNYKVTVSGTLGTPKVLTLGAPNLDFTLASGSTCTGAVAAGAVCTVNVVFSPLATGVRNGSVEITDGGGNVLATTSVYGIGQAPPSGPPVAQISTALLSFGTIIFAPSNSETLPLTITNVGGGTLTVSPSINGPSYSIVVNTCASGVTGGSSCALTIQFAPVRVGPHVDTLSLQSNGLSAPTVLLTGTGSGVGPETEGTLNFGTIPFGTSAVLPLTIFSVGVTGTLTVSTSVSSDPSFKVLTTAQNTCLAGISGGQTCVLPVEFAPAWVGVHSNHITVTPSNGFPPSTVPLYGIANAAP